MKNFTIVLVLMTLLFTNIAIAADDSQSISDLSPLIDDSDVKLGKSTYSDVELSHWANPAINKLSSKGIVSGYPDGTFRPEKEISKAEFAKLMVVSLNLAEKNTSVKFKDVDPNMWYYNYVYMASKYMLTNGNSFYPDSTITREEVAYAIVRGLRLEDSNYNELTISRFYDKDQISKGLEKYIIIIADSGIMVGNEDGTFNPKGNLTRAQVTQLLYNIQKNYKIETDTLIEVPVIEDLVYNGRAQTPKSQAKKGFSIEGNIKATEPGEYTAVATLSTGYRWNDGSKDNKNVVWRIVKADAKLSTSSSISMNEGNNKKVSYTYDGDGTISVTSLNPEIAEVILDAKSKSFTINALKPGTTTIVLYASEGTHFLETYSNTNLEIISKYDKK